MKDETCGCAGPAPLRQPVLAAPHRVVDPEGAMSILDVGLAYDVTVTPGCLHVVMTMTSTARRRGRQCAGAGRLRRHHGRRSAGLAPTVQGTPWH